MRSLCPEKTENNNFSNRLWKLLVWVAESMVFLLAGITITLSLFIDQWLAILIGIAAVILSRVTIILGVFPFFFFLPGVEIVTLRQQMILAGAEYEEPLHLR